MQAFIVLAPRSFNHQLKAMAADTLADLASPFMRGAP